jgi:hypothetical protein
LEIFASSSKNFGFGYSHSPIQRNDVARLSVSVEKAQQLIIRFSVAGTARLWPRIARRG